MGRMTITVSYIDLLEKTANVLGFDVPLYGAIRSANCKAYVTVSSTARLLSYVFDGNSLGTFTQSCEDAAKKAILFFVRNNGVCIHDVNFERVVGLRECRRLYALKCVELDAIEMGSVAPSVNIGMGESSHCSLQTCVQLDHMELLRTITSAAEVYVTPIEYIRCGDEAFQAWFTIEDLSAALGTHCVIGDRASSINDAKQVLAQKAVSMLVAYHGVVVEDINSFRIPIEECALKETRELYIARKGSVYGFSEQMSPTPNIVEQDQFTPCGKHFAVSASDGPPPPPKKARATAKMSIEATVPHSVVAAALDTLAAESRDP